MLEMMFCFREVRVIRRLGGESYLFGIRRFTIGL